MPKPEIVMRKNKPVSVISALAEEEALKKGMEEKGSEIYSQA